MYIAHHALSALLRLWTHDRLHRVGVGAVHRDLSSRRFEVTHVPGIDNVDIAVLATANEQIRARMPDAAIDAGRSNVPHRLLFERSRIIREQPSVQRPTALTIGREPDIQY